MLELSDFLRQLPVDPLNVGHFTFSLRSQIIELRVDDLLQLRVNPVQVIKLVNINPQLFLGEDFAIVMF